MTNYNKYSLSADNPTLPNGLRRSDIIGYSNLKQSSKDRALETTKELILKLRTGITLTSILPPHITIDLWLQLANPHLKTKYRFVCNKAWDGGSNFYIESITRD